MMNSEARAELLRTGQEFFLKYYIDIVAKHPFGIKASEVKRLAGKQIAAEFGFDPFDASIVGINPSRGISRGDQWANNLVSNKRLHSFMLVERLGKRTKILFPLYPAGQEPTVAESVKAAFVASEHFISTAGARLPVTHETSVNSFLRSPQLAEAVRRISDFACLVKSEACTIFKSRQSVNYVEVHHILPMSAQNRTPCNLDRLENMVTLCVSCHAKLHRADAVIARALLARLLDRYAITRQIEFSSAMSGASLDCSLDAIFSLY